MISITLDLFDAKIRKRVLKKLYFMPKDDFGDNKG